MLTGIDSLLRQLKKRRKALGLKQSDMMLRIGVSRQQYQRLEAKGNPRLDTLELIAKGLNSELLLIPKEKLRAVKALLEGDALDSKGSLDSSADKQSKDGQSPSEDPWQSFFEEKS